MILGTTLNRSEVRFDWYEPQGKRHKFVTATHLPTGNSSNGRGRTVNEAKNNAWVKLARGLGVKP
jgi:hypothetical protein